TATPATVSVTKRSTSTSLSCVPSSITTLETSSCSVVASDTSPQSPLGQVGMGGSITMAVTGASWSQCTSPCILSSLSGALTLVPTNPGTATVTATYSGDEVHLGSAGPDTTVTVTLPTTHTTTTTVSCSPNPILAGVTSICTATVTDTSTTGATTPTGQVNVNIGNLPSGSCTLSGTAATASCSVPISLPQASIFNIQGFYQGDTTHAASSGSTSLNVTTRPTITIVT